MDNLERQIRLLRIEILEGALAQTRASGAYHKAYHGEFGSYSTCEAGRCKHCEAMVAHLVDLKASVEAGS